MSCLAGSREPLLIGYYFFHLLSSRISLMFWIPPMTSCLCRSGEAGCDILGGEHGSQPRGPGRSRGGGGRRRRARGWGAAPHRCTIARCMYCTQDAEFTAAVGPCACVSAGHELFAVVSASKSGGKEPPRDGGFRDRVIPQLLRTTSGWDGPSAPPLFARFN